MSYSGAFLLKTAPNPIYTTLNPPNNIPNMSPKPAQKWSKPLSPNPSPNLQRTSPTTQTIQVLLGRICSKTIRETKDVWTIIVFFGTGTIGFIHPFLSWYPIKYEISYRTSYTHKVLRESTGNTCCVMCPTCSTSRALNILSFFNGIRGLAWLEQIRKTCRKHPALTPCPNSYMAMSYDPKTPSG